MKTTKGTQGCEKNGAAAQEIFGLQTKYEKLGFYVKCCQNLLQAAAAAATVIYLSSLFQMRLEKLLITTSVNTTILLLVTPSVSSDVARLFIIWVVHNFI